MANIKITDLTAYTDAASTDVLPIVDVGADVTKKITIGNVVKAVPLGTAALPGLAFDGDPNSGVYSPGADQVAISTNGVGRLFIDSSGRLGLGTSSPDTAFHLASTSPVFRFENPTTASTTGTSMGKIEWETRDASAPGVIGYIDVNDSNNFGTAFDMNFATGISGSASTKVTIKADGKVGIGTTSPAAPLDVVGVGRFSGGNGYVSFGDNGYIRTDVANELRFQGGTSGTSFWKSGLSSESVRIDNSGRLLVGTSTARSNFFNATVASQFQVEGATAATAMASVVRCSADADASNIVLGKTRSASVGGNTIVNSNDQIGQIGFHASDGTELVVAATIRGEVDGTPGANDMPGRLVFSTTADGASSPTERMKITSTGQMYLSSATPGAASFGTSIGRIAPGLVESYRNVDGTSSVLNVGGTAGYARVMGDGDLENTNNSYTGISDVKLKENIVDANSQWDDLKAIQVRKYNFKAETGYNTHTQIGLIAQEVELISPGLVGESIDEETGESTKSVNYSVLYMKAVKALQEAMERIEVLEQRLTDAGIA